MTEDNGCKVCGKHFEDPEDLKNHGKDDHPEVQENYPDLFDKKEEPAEEIDQQQDKPVQSHDEWQKELEGLQDEFSEEGGAGSGPREGSKPALLPEQVARADDPHYNPFKSTPKSQLMQTDPYVTRTTEAGQSGDPFSPISADVGFTEAEDDEEENEEWITQPMQYDKKAEQQWQEDHDDAEEDRGTDAIMNKVQNLAGGIEKLSENYRFLSKDAKAKIFESLGLTQGDANILAGLQWNELTRPIRVEASEAYVKEQADVPDEEYEQEQREEAKQQEDEDKVYENFYNLEKNHSSPDFKKKAIECNRCNEAFYNIVDRDVHFNEVHATEDTYNLPEECPFCNIELPEGQDLDYHMSTAHGAHVPSEYTQTGVDAGMADANWDKIEYAGASRASEEFKKYFYDDLPPEIKEEYTNLYGHTSNWVILPNSMEQKLKSITGESRAKEYEIHPNEELFLRAVDTPDANTEGLPIHASGVYWNCDLCGFKTYAGPDNLFANADPIKPHLRDVHSIGESRSSDLKKEIKKLTNFINIASIENPMNMGYKEDELQGLKDELESLGGEELEATEGQGGTYGRYDYMLNPEHTDITTCIVCGRSIDDHSNPSTDYRGRSGTAPETDHYYQGGDVGGSDDKYDFESKATEDGMYANFGKKDNDDSWTVLTVGSDLLFFNSREEAEDYTKNFPSDTYQISPPKSGKESYAKEDGWSDKDIKEQLEGKIDWEWNKLPMTKRKQLAIDAGVDEISAGRWAMTTV